MSGGSKVQTTRTEPWEQQKPYLETGFKRAEDLYTSGKLTPGYYGGATLAGFNPAETAGQESALTYLTAGRAPNLMAGAETTALDTMGYGRGAMGYGAGMAQPLTQAQYAGLTPFSESQYGDLLAGNVNTDVFGPLADAYRQEAMGQLTGEVLPGIRTAITQSQAGGGTRGDILQANATAAAQQRISDNLAKAEFGAYQQAQADRLAAAQMGLGAQQAGMGYGMQGAEAAQGALSQYPSIMGAPLQAYDKMQGIGAQRRAMDQAQIQQDMQKYQYEAALPQIGLQNYLAGISGEYGGTSTGVGPGGPNPLLSALAGAGSGFLTGGPTGALAGAVYGGVSALGP